ncbi:hypothetical protein [Actinoplanes utahensis]|uniref:Uncharacterized protein n=1 Tax=Actinoplanes utahensis TaxID=1869 RepID=A0A0A6UES9_ACTUT|nr:hypothetical protein [Actinoplanes utahensis]KHD73598.1 hypothetical protein MB27_34335 [Actinoplanes utahensis]GIF33956.1 hypothetical protein Aut01nite_69420 [Actinoplanes utahensis]
MELREELLPPPVAPERIARLSAVIERIGDLMDSGEPFGEEIAAFNADTGGDHDAHTFHTYDS